MTYKVVADEIDFSKGPDPYKESPWTEILMEEFKEAMLEAKKNQKYRCPNCNHICKKENRLSDSMWIYEDPKDIETVIDEQWCDNICPKCECWLDDSDWRLV